MRDATEASLLYFSSEVERMGEELGLPPHVPEFALRLFVQALEKGYRPATLDRASATCLYLSVRVNEVTATIDSVADVSRRESKHLYGESGKLIDILNLPVRPEDPTDFVEQMGGELNFTEGELKRAIALSEDAKEHNLHSGRAPSAFAASVLYARSKIETLGHTQQEIAEVAEVTSVSIRNYYRDIMQCAPDVDPRALASRDFQVACELIEDRFELAPDVCAAARTQIEGFTETTDTGGMSKGSIASAAYIVAARDSGHDVERSEIAEAVDVSAQTILKYEGELS